jgi:hypothetical protein
MAMGDPTPRELDSRTIEFYQVVLTSLHDAGIPHLVGGTFAMERLAGIARQTKDLDLFVKRQDLDRITEVLAAAGVDCGIAFEHWLAKATRGDLLVDLIFANGNSLAKVDDEWFAHAIPAVVLGLPAQICAAEEMIWSKSFVMERERFDGSDVLHILRQSARQLDWDRLIRHFDEHAGVLLAHLVLFLYVYPDAHAMVPERVLDELWERRLVVPPGGDRVCRGTLLSRAQYLVDVHGWGYTDARLAPHGPMTDREVIAWTAEVEATKVPSPV